MHVLHFRSIRNIYAAHIFAKVFLVILRMPVHVHNRALFNVAKESNASGAFIGFHTAVSVVTE